MALSASGRSAVNSSTFTHNSRATTSSRSHKMRMWPVFFSRPPQKRQGSAGITLWVTFGRHRRMTWGGSRLPDASDPDV